MVGRILVAVGMVLLVAAAVQPAVAQTELPSCVAKLTDCASDLNSTKPSKTCCSSIKNVVANDRKCLCSLLNNTELLQGFQINVTQALELPKRCGITEGVSICNSVTNSTIPPASSPSTESSAGTPPSKDNTGRNTWMGMYGAMSLLIFWWSIVA